MGAGADPFRGIERGEMVPGAIRGTSILGMLGVGRAGVCGALCLDEPMMSSTWAMLRSDDPWYTCTAIELPIFPTRTAESMVRPRKVPAARRRDCSASPARTSAAPMMTRRSEGVLESLAATEPRPFMSWYE